MKNFSPLLMIAAFFTLQACTSQNQAEKTELDTSSEKLSYALGQEFGANMKQLETGIDLPALIQGIRDTLNGRPALLTDQEVEAILHEFRKTDDERFLEENKEKEGVLTTASGLQYKVLKEGAGPKPKATDRVTVHYRGTLIDGREFDSSYKRGEPATFPLNRVIPGWTEGLQLMNVGSKYEFYIPSRLAYRDRGAGGLIGPGATLIFQVELLKIQ
ncbi:MAG: FKBP-type peptidyl-prolyl cis-trans isomerase [bacterium]